MSLQRSRTPPLNFQRSANCKFVQFAATEDPRELVVHGSHDRDTRPEARFQDAKTSRRGGRGSRPDSATRRDLGVPGPQWRRQDDDPAHAGHPDAAKRRVGPRRRLRPEHAARQDPRANRLRRPGRGRRPGDHRTPRARLSGPAYGMSRKQAEARAAELITMLELESCADRQGKTYSGGQKRRLDIGLGLVHDPQLLFLDDPTTGLDPQSRARVWDEVRRMHDRGTTVFLTTHYLDEADALCDRVAIIVYGRIVAEGTPEELKRDVAGDVVTLTVAGPSQNALDRLQDQPYVREASIEDGTVRLYVDRGEVAMPAILRQLDAAGLQLLTIGLHRPSLDDVFLRKTGRSLREVAA